MKTSRVLKKSNFRAGSDIEKDKELPKHLKFVVSKCHESGSSKKVQKDNKLQPNLMRGVIDHDVINIST